MIKINGKEVKRDSPAYWAFFITITELGQRLGKDKTAFLYEKKDQNHEVKLTIDGLECDFVHILNRYDDGVNEEIAKASAAFVKNKLADVWDKINAATEDLTDALTNDAYKKLGIKRPSED